MQIQKSFYRFVCYTIILTVLLLSEAHGIHNLRNALDAVRKNNNALKVELQKLNATKLERAKAISEFWPIVEVNASITSIGKKISPNKFDESGNHMQAGLHIQQNLFAGRGTIAKLNQAENIINAAEYSFFHKENDLLFKAIEIYQKVIVERKIYQIRTHNEQTQRKNFEKVQIRFDAGEVTKTDISMAQYKVAAAITAREKALGDMRSAEAEFAYIIGESPAADLEPINLNFISIPPTIDQFISLVMQHNPTLSIGRYYAHAAKHAIESATAELIPQINASFSAVRSNEPRSSMTRFGPTINPNNPDGNTIALSIKFPIFERGLTQLRIKEAKFRSLQAAYELDNIRGKAKESSVLVWSRYHTSIANVSSTKAAERAAQDALDGTTEEYSVGAKTTLDLLKATEELHEQQIQHEKAKEALISSAFYMHFLIGDLHTLDIT